jgi:hypothetical protein
MGCVWGRSGQDIQSEMDSRRHDQQTGVWMRLPTGTFLADVFFVLVFASRQGAPCVNDAGTVWRCADALRLTAGRGGQHSWLVSSADAA